MFVDVFELAEVAMAAVADGECRERQSECRDGLYKSINRRVTWTVFWAFVVVLLAVGGAVIGYAVNRAASAPSQDSVRENRAAVLQAQSTIADNRVTIARLEVGVEAIRTEQLRTQETLRAQTVMLEAVLREVRKKNGDGH